MLQRRFGVVQIALIESESLLGDKKDSQSWGRGIGQRGECKQVTNRSTMKYGLISSVWIFFIVPSCQYFKIRDFLCKSVILIYLNKRKLQFRLSCIQLSALKLSPAFRRDLLSSVWCCPSLFSWSLVSSMRKVTGVHEEDPAPKIVNHSVTRAITPGNSVRWRRKHKIGIRLW